jgi:hypothetical protein
MGKALWYIFGGTIVSGLILGIYVLTGTSVDFTDLLLLVTGKFVEATNNQQTTSFWNTLTGFITVIGIVQSVTTILSYIAKGVKGIVIAALGFFGTLALIVGLGSVVTYVGLILLIVGGCICLYLEGNAPDDMLISSYYD